MRILIGLDNTGTKENNGTGEMARRLGEYIQFDGLAQVESITRHFLLNSPEIQFSLQNKAYCITASTEEINYATLADKCRSYLKRNIAPGSDAGFCLAEWERVGSAIQNFGKRAKSQALSQLDTLTLTESIISEGLSGNGDGIIGALASIGLRAGGRDGSFTWLPGLKELRGEYTPDELHQAAHINEVRQMTGVLIRQTESIDVGKSVQPLLHDGRAVLFVEKTCEDGKIKWRTLSTETINQMSR